MTTGLLLPAASAAQAAEEPWAVALGDSYISGEGAVYTNKHTAVDDPANPDPAEWTWARDTIGSLPSIYYDKPDASGEQIPWCHRSPFAPGVVEGYQTLNLACSGAEAISKLNIPTTLGGTPIPEKAIPKPGVDFAELDWQGMKIPGQAKVLEEFAKTNDVKVIFLSIGGNDFEFAKLAEAILVGGTITFGSTPVTFAAIDTPQNPATEAQKDAYAKWSGDAQVQMTAERVKSAVLNIEQAMTNAGKSPSDYKIVYQSTPRPVPDGPDYNPQETGDLFDVIDNMGSKSRIGGCPVWGKDDGTAVFEPLRDMTGFPGDAEWIYDTVFPNLVRAQREGVQAAASELGPDGPTVVFNDVSDSFAGHELCGKDVVRQANWEPKQYSWPDNPPTYGPGQGADTEWINAVGFATTFPASLAELTDSAIDLTQVLHPNYWGQRALAACNELAAASDAPYVVCEQDPAGGADAQGRPMMKASTPSDFTPMAPMRAVDTRTATESRAAGPLAAGAPVEIDLTGMIPAGATAVSYNLTVTDQTASGYAEVAPAGAAAGSSTINWTGPLQTIANGHISKVNGGKVQVTLGGSGTAHVILDITGAFTAAGTSPDAGGFTAVERRVHDSRDGDGPLAPGASRTLNINDDVRAMAAGSAPVAAAVNVTVTGTTGSGVLSVAKETTATTSTINWSGTNQTIANAVITDVAEDGSFTVTNNGKTPAEIVVDLTGTFTPGTGAKFYATDPARSYDSRTSDRPLTDTRSRVNTHPVPAEAVAVAVNTTITGTTGSGWLAVTNSATTTPMTSTVNWYESPTTRANGSISGATDATTRAHVGGLGSTNYLLDVAGYFQ